MKYRSVFDIIGPIMIGPSSSHTAGAARIGLIARNLFSGNPKTAHIVFLGSFAKTFKGHGTDIAIVGGILGFNTFDKRIVDSFDWAKKIGVQVQISVSEVIPNHPNTAQITLSSDQETMTIEGISIGGGKMEITSINGYSLRITGEGPTILIWHEDRYGLVAAVSHVLAKHQVNIGYMEMARKEKGSESLMVIEIDQPIADDVRREIEALAHIKKVTVLNPLD
ncbi:L-serine ammonia-lyase, iron-sulfur-dependent subunit beta [Ammoniphilus sp. YIM 78166]|uniref:L-serine ammonia-lyase, iron-sulfur-dependent subunit beta n=1 Tax=Ammoniphilus sp. YIM 78166 TaxID=1644106 RepID=UPI0010702401|nr:L-serine ammonia-lyase, iron-sulfur-dependent subunit beta [Ammoniphilus sp. YIM 78166]